MNPLEHVKKLITTGLEGAHVEVNDMTGTLDHLEILIVSDQFAGKRVLQQHQMVMDILREDLKEKIHAVKLTTKTFEQYNK